MRDWQMTLWVLGAALVLAMGKSALAEEQGSGEQGGQLNPEEMTLGRMVENAARGEVDMMTCASGYYMTKSGDHAAARQVFTRCAEAGYSAAMTWMSALEDNGLGGPENPQAASAWDAQAAQSGDPVGQFNLGLDLLRGRGTARDPERGRALVDAAAGAGLGAAKQLQDAGYDPRAVTPDADERRYLPQG